MAPEIIRWPRNFEEVKRGFSAINSKWVIARNVSNLAAKLCPILKNCRKKVKCKNKLLFYNTFHIMKCTSLKYAYLTKFCKFYKSSGHGNDTSRHENDKG